MTVGENIRRLRKEKGLTQKQLGNLCGINEANIRKYELGGANPKIETLDKIASVLETTTDELRGIKTLEHFTPEVISQNKHIDEILSISLERILAGYGISYDVKNFPPNIKADLYNTTFHHVTFDENNNNATIYPLIRPNKLTELYNMLNLKGKKEALKRMKELTELECYTKPEEESSEKYPSDVSQ